MEGFKAIVFSYKNTPLEVREKIAFQSSELADFLILLKDSLQLEDLLLVSTCNRTEVYYSSKDEIKDILLKHLAAYKGIEYPVLLEYLDFYDSILATKHLFRVSLGLESQVLGDIQISNQVKRAYQASADLNLSGPYLHRLMHTIFYANKRVVQETRLQDGTASVASVAVDLIDSFVRKMINPRITLIGLGEIGQNVLETLVT